jgi:hypothetical protein
MGGTRSTQGRDEKYNVKILGVDWKIVLEWIWGGRVWTECMWLEIGTSGSPF